MGSRGRIRSPCCLSLDEMHNNGSFEVECCPTNDQAADCFTKGLYKLKHWHALELLGVGQGNGPAN
eukprot:1636149-Amphidinium_carterae.1